MLASPKTGKVSARLVTLLVLLLCCFLIVPPCLFGHVICFGTDGHVALETNQDGQCGTQDNATIVSSLHQSSSVLNIEDHCGGCFDIVVPAISPNLSYVSPRQESIVEKPSTIYATFVLPSYLVSTLIDYPLSIGTWQAKSADFQTVILRL